MFGGMSERALEGAPTFTGWAAVPIGYRTRGQWQRDGREVPAGTRADGWVRCPKRWGTGTQTVPLFVHDATRALPKHSKAETQKHD